LATYSPFEDAKGYDGKVLILRGTEDNLVDDKTCETYLDGYTGNRTFVKIPKGNHNFASIPAREACESEILNFVKSIL
ncbi:alpha/beta hydrolase, partial [Thomasclavelia ramosa]|uniref:alpha/beta hydrolase n=1 Tax=Thomasclavelia ramosa TaxID=1547 RepID=UPI001D00D4B9